MLKIKFLCFLWVVFFSATISAQRKDIKGQLIAKGDVEGLHILNKTASRYDISSENGRFVISAKAQDTLVISGIKYLLKEVIITEEIFEKGLLRVPLVEKINELNPVVLGKIFTGSLESDIQNSDAKPEINFYDLGIPGNTNKPLTQNERKLFDADAGPTAMIMGGPFGGGLGLNFHKLLNTISGRTKKLKAIVDLDNRDKCMNRLRREYESIIFERDTLVENLRNEYFLFAQEDSGFLNLCNRNNDIESIDFLKLKLKEYNAIRSSFAKD